MTKKKTPETAENPQDVVIAARVGQSLGNSSQGSQIEQECLRRQALKDRFKKDGIE